jgi:uncharacterized alkaline shock family protein YloU
MVATRPTSRATRRTIRKASEPMMAVAQNVGGQLDFTRAVFAEIAARVLRDIRDVKQTTGDVMTGFLGRLLSRGATHPGVQVEERGEEVVFHLDVVAKHGANFYDLGLEIQRRITERVRHMTGRPSVVNVSVRGVSL